jgi:hypothetical protein
MVEIVSLTDIELSDIKNWKPAFEPGMDYPGVFTRRPM